MGPLSLWAGNEGSFLPKKRAHTVIHLSTFYEQNDRSGVPHKVDRLVSMWVEILQVASQPAKCKASSFFEHSPTLASWLTLLDRHFFGCHRYLRCFRAQIDIDSTIAQSAFSFHNQSFLFFVFFLFSSSVFSSCPGSTSKKKNFNISKPSSVCLTVETVVSAHPVCVFLGNLASN